MNSYRDQSAHDRDGIKYDISIAFQILHHDHCCFDSWYIHFSLLLLCLYSLIRTSEYLLVIIQFICTFRNFVCTQPNILMDLSIFVVLQFSEIRKSEPIIKQVFSKQIMHQHKSIPPYSNLCLNILFWASGRSDKIMERCCPCGLLCSSCSEHSIPQLLALVKSEC